MQKAIGISSELVEYLETYAEQLITDRKKTKAPEEYPRKTDMKNFTQTQEIALESSVVSIDLDDPIVLLSFTNGTQQFIDLDSKEAVGSFRAEGAGKIIENSSEVVVVGEETIVYNNEQGEVKYVVTCHEEVNCVSVHPCGRYLAVGSSDCSWTLHDIEKGQLLAQVKTSSPVTAIEFHCDGLVLCVGLSSGKIILFDVRTQEAAKELSGVVQSPVKKIAFSNKGIHLAVSWEDCATCRVYMLHKNCEHCDIDHHGAGVKTFGFDHFGQFLVTAAGEKLKAFYYRDFTSPVAVLDQSAS